MAKNSDIRQAWTEAQADALYRDHKAKEAAQARNETNTVEGDHHGMTGGVHDGGQFKFQLRSGAAEHLGRTTAAPPPLSPSQTRRQRHVRIALCPAVRRAPACRPPPADRPPGRAQGLLWDEGVAGQRSPRQDPRRRGHGRSRGRRRGARRKCRRLGERGGLVWIGGTHAVIDRRWPVRWWMQLTRQAGFAQHGGAAHVDQTAHVLALAVAALFLAAV